MTTLSTHTQNQWKLHALIWLGTTSIPAYRVKFTVDLKVSNLTVLVFKNILTQPHWNKLIQSPVSDSSTHLPQNYVLLTLRPRDIATSVLEWSQVTHIPASTTTGLKSHASAVPLSDNHATTLVFQIAVSLSSTLTNIQAHSDYLYTFLVAWDVLWGQL